MTTSLRSTARTLWVAIRAMVVFTMLFGVLYTLAVTGIGQVAFPAQANGSVLRADGRAVGSALIGQAFVDKHGNPLPQYFQPRPSAAGNGYDAGLSSGSNWGPGNEDLIAAIRNRKAQVGAFNDVPEGAIPADAVTASSSGLDPQISPAYAAIQAARVAKARRLPIRTVRALIVSHTQGRDLGYLGEPTVNVLVLNLALDELEN